MEIVEEEPGLWVLKEAEVSYDSESGTRIGAKA